MIHRMTAWAITLLAAMSVTSAASANSLTRSINTGNVDITTVVEFGNTTPAVVIDQSDPINIARVIEFGGSGTVDSTIIQTGTRNVANVFQIGGTTNSIIGQSGLTNAAYVMQIGNSTNSLIAQFGNMNTGSVSQFGRSNWSAIFQFGR